MSSPWLRPKRTGFALHARAPDGRDMPDVWDILDNLENEKVRRG